MTPDDDTNFQNQQDDKPQAICCRVCKKVVLLEQTMPQSMMCKPCHYKPRRPTQLTETELLAKAHARKIHPGLVEQILQTRKRNAKDKQKEAAHKRWAKERGDQWDVLISLRNAERKKAKAAYDYAINPKYGYRQYEAEFYAHYMTVLERVGETLRRNKRNGAAITINEWAELVTTAEQVELRRLWAEIPIDRTARGRKRQPPAVLDITTHIPDIVDEGLLKDMEGVAPTSTDTPPTEDKVGTDTPPQDPWWENP